MPRSVSSPAALHEGERGEGRQRKHTEKNGLEGVSPQDVGKKQEQTGGNQQKDERYRLEDQFPPLPSS